jgi:hypothetical protein
VEHLDCAGYRLDAWRSALVGLELEVLRDGEEGALSRRGVLIGAYGWLESLRPAAAPAEPVTLDDDLAADFQKPGDTQLVHDPASRGRIHAPSPDHAVTAAILRNGYLAGATPENPDTLAIELTSERVRLALATIDGIRNGQPLGALLGYQLERGLHDAGDLYLDRVIYPLRQAFPLAGNRIESTKDEGKPITAVEARNVVDGLAFAEHIDATRATTYPYGLTGLPLGELTDTTTMTAAEIGAVIDGVVHRMRSVSDAVADVAMAESVFQVVKGNYDRRVGRHPYPLRCKQPQAMRSKGPEARHEGRNATARWNDRNGRASACRRMTTSRLLPPSEQERAGSAASLLRLVQLSSERRGAGGAVELLLPSESSGLNLRSRCASDALAAVASPEASPFHARQRSQP